MEKIVKLFVVCITLCSCNIDGLAQRSLNLDFELRDYDVSSPKNWFTGGEGFKISLDDLEKHAGKLCLKMEMPGAANGKFGVFTGTLPLDVFAGKNVEYRGWIKTKDVKSGYAGLWLRVDGSGGTLGFDNMFDRGLKGDNDWTQVSIKLDVGKDAVNINYGGLFPGEGTVWFDDLELYVDGEKYVDVIEPEPKSSLSQKEITALKKYIYPLRTYEPDGGDTKDLKVLDKLIGNSRVVALGEVSHGSSEIFKMKNRIIQYLAVNNGFDIFSIEAAMPESYKLNDYTVRGEGDPKKLIAGMYFWTWRTEEVLNMVEWMRKFNQPKQRIAFTGFDMQVYNGAVNELLDVFKGNSPMENKINDLKKILDEIKTRSQQNRGMISVGYSDAKVIDSILVFSQNSIEASHFQPSQKAWLQQNITVIRQYLDLGNNNNFSWRDKCMADNIMWIKEQNRDTDSKLVVWAHNGHIYIINITFASCSLNKPYSDYFLVFQSALYLVMLLKCVLLLDWE